MLKNLWPFRQINELKERNNKLTNLALDLETLYAETGNYLYAQNKKVVRYVKSAEYNNILAQGQKYGVATNTLAPASITIKGGSVVQDFDNSQPFIQRHSSFVLVQTDSFSATLALVSAQDFANWEGVMTGTLQVH